MDEYREQSDGERYREALRRIAGLCEQKGMRLKKVKAAAEMALVEIEMTSVVVPIDTPDNTWLTDD